MRTRPLNVVEPTPHEPVSFHTAVGSAVHGPPHVQAQTHAERIGGDLKRNAATRSATAAASGSAADHRTAQLAHNMAASHFASMGGHMEDAQGHMRAAQAHEAAQRGSAHAGGPHVGPLGGGHAPSHGYTEHPAITHALNQFHRTDGEPQGSTHLIPASHGVSPNHAAGSSQHEPHMTQRGKKGGTFYINAQGQKVYTKKK